MGEFVLALDIIILMWCRQNKTTSDFSLTIYNRINSVVPRDTAMSMSTLF